MDEGAEVPACAEAEGVTIFCCLYTGSPDSLPRSSSSGGRADTLAATASTGQPQGRPTATRPGQGRSRGEGPRFQECRSRWRAKSGSSRRSETSSSRVSSIPFSCRPSRSSITISLSSPSFDPSTHASANPVPSHPTMVESMTPAPMAPTSTSKPRLHRQVRQVPTPLSPPARYSDRPRARAEGHEAVLNGGQFF